MATISKRDFAKQYLKAALCIENQDKFGVLCRKDFIQFAKHNDEEQTHRVRIKKQLLRDAYVHYLRKCLQEDTADGCIERIEKNWKDISEGDQLVYAFQTGKFADHARRAKDMLIRNQKREESQKRRDKEDNVRVSAQHKKEKTKRRNDDDAGEPVIIKKEHMFSDDEEDDNPDARSEEQDEGYVLEKHDTSSEEEDDH